MCVKRTPYSSTLCSGLYCSRTQHPGLSRALAHARMSRAMCDVSALCALDSGYTQVSSIFSSRILTSRPAAPKCHWSLPPPGQGVHPTPTAHHSASVAGAASASAAASAPACSPRERAWKLWAHAVTPTSLGAHLGEVPQGGTTGPRRPTLYYGAQRAAACQRG